MERNNEAVTHQPSPLNNDILVEARAVTITLNHFSAAAVFALFASVVFGITHRDNTREMIRYGLYCFAWFLGGVLVAGWVMWLLRR